MLPSVIVAFMAMTWLPLASATQQASPGKYFSRAGYKKCPDTCEDTGLQAANWTTFSDVDRFLACKQKPKLFDLAVHTPLDSPDTNVFLRSCSSVADDKVTQQQSVQVVDNVSSKKNGSVSVSAFTKEHGCAADETLRSIQQPSVSWTGSPSSKKGPRGQVLGATLALQAQLLAGDAACARGETTLFAHYGKTTVGLYAGSRLQNQGTAAVLIDRFLEYIHNSSMPEKLALQLCGEEDRTAEFVFGIYADTTPGMAGLVNTQKAVAAWSNATCLEGFDETTSLGNVTVAVLKAPDAVGSSARETTTVSRRHQHHRHHNSHRSSVLHPHRSSVLHPRADCSTTEVLPGEGCWAVADRCGISQADLQKYNGGGSFCNNLQAYQKVCCSSGSLPSTEPPANEDGTCVVEQVVSGDSCGSLASRCGITGAQFEEYNKKSSLCSSLAVGQWVCCSKGDMPDMTPKPNPNGSCATYMVVEDDSCAKIAAAHALTNARIVDFNKDSWGFNGCGNLMIGAVLCVSKGTPPMPSPIANALCGPQVPDTPTPKDTSRSALVKLNPCPLNACCNIWGQCGTTEDFCKVTGNGSPGDVKPGTNGCISNCGTEIVNNKQGPATFRSITYFEAWNANRKCLYMDVTDIPISQHTHIHFSFVDLTPGFGISTQSIQAQFDKFVKMDGSKIKRIAAFGGWAASTEPSTFYLFRDGVKPENRETLASNLAAFILKYDLEGIDIDWEYPAAPDIPGIPPADPVDGEHYRDFLKVLRKKLPNKSISVAAPASYWYLRGYPIDEIAEIVDYIVFMTYDLHGQWDYDSPWAQEGCPEGNCLRSHVNITETYNSLAMVTKAGVPSHKISVGISSYGRSFRAAKAGCDGPMCRYLADGNKDSVAAPGRCTDTAGYVSNAEINEIMVKNANARWFRDEDSESDILVYDNVEWVAFMNEENKLRRIQRWQSLNFGGVSDWAEDLKKFSAGESGGITPMPIEERAWQALPCTIKAVTDVRMDNDKRWEGIRANAAWEDVKKAWKKRDKNDKLSFPQFVSDFFHGGENMNCDLLQADNGCRETYLCKDFEGIDGTGPAAYFILNALNNLNRWLWNMHSAVDGASENISPATFSKAFAHKDRGDNEFLIFMILNALTVGMTMGVAPLFNTMLKKGISETIKENIKATTGALVSVGATQTKEIMQHINTDDDADAYVERAFKVAGKGLKKSLALLTVGIYSGDEASLDFLDQALKGGALLETVDDKHTVESEEKWEAALYGTMISHTWEMVGITPVIIDTEADCDETGVGVGDYISTSLAEYARGCVDGRLYYLVDPDGKPQWNDGNGKWARNMYSEPNGLKTVYNGNWEGVTVQDMIESAVRWTKKNGNRMSEKEGYDPSFKKSWDDVWKVIDGNMVRTPGVIDIPVCNEKVAWDNWFNHYGDSKPRWYSYPCTPALNIPPS